MGRGREGGEAKSEGWSSGSDATSDAETEEDGWGYTPLTVSPWGMQESGARGLWVDVKAGESNGRKVPSTTADEAYMRCRHGSMREQGAKKEGWRGWDRA